MSTFYSAQRCAAFCTFSQRIKFMGDVFKFILIIHLKLLPLPIPITQNTPCKFSEKHDFAIPLSLYSRRSIVISKVPELFSWPSRAAPTTYVSRNYGGRRAVCVGWAVFVSVMFNHKYEYRRFHIGMNFTCLKSKRNVFAPRRVATYI